MQTLTLESINKLIVFKMLIKDADTDTELPIKFEYLSSFHTDNAMSYIL